MVAQVGWSVVVRAMRGDVMRATPQLCHTPSMRRQGWRAGACRWREGTRASRGGGLGRRKPVSFLGDDRGSPRCLASLSIPATPLWRVRFPTSSHQPIVNVPSVSRWPRITFVYAIWLCIFGQLGLDFRCRPRLPGQREANDFNFFFWWFFSWLFFLFLVFFFWFEHVFVGFLFSCVLFCCSFRFVSFQLASPIRVVCASPPRPAPTPTLTEDFNSGSSPWTFPQRPS